MTPKERDDDHYAQAYTLNQADYEKLSNVLRRRHQNMREEYNAKFLTPVLRAADELDRLTAEVERLKRIIAGMT